MHPFVARLMQLSFGACALAGCKTVCNQADIARSKPTDELAERYPTAIAEAWAASSELGSGSVPIEPKSCAKMCGPKATQCTLEVHPDQTTKLHASVRCVFGSREECHQDFDPLNMGSCPYGCGRLPGEIDLAPYTPLERVFVLEALSVVAFRDLARDLRRFGAPRSLRSRVLRAARDEARHARLARTLLNRDVTLPPVPRRQRSLEEAAILNATEGCARESFGALVAIGLARHGHELYAAIADDELEHAALSHDLHAWFMERLANRSRARVEQALHGALSALPGALGVALRAELS